MLTVNEIFYSIQGEGFWAGRAAVFVRLSGCNRNCQWCDTKYHNSGIKLSVQDTLDWILQCAPFNDFVVITGGEPTLQKEAAELADRLLKEEGKYVALETNGTVPSNLFDYGKFAWITMSPKEGAPFLRAANEIKVVYEGQDLTPYEDGDYDHWYLQPCDFKGVMNIKEVVEKVKSNNRWKLSLQTHKIGNFR